MGHRAASIQKSAQNKTHGNRLPCVFWFEPELDFETVQLRPLSCDLFEQSPPSRGCNSGLLTLFLIFRRIVSRNLLLLLL